MTFETWFQQKHSDISTTSAAAVLRLSSEGATLPFIARYRKEQTGNLDEVGIQKVLDAKEDWDQILRKQEHMVGEIEKQNKLTPELKEKILTTFQLETLEDIYLPYKQKRKSKATKAKEAGLEPLADWIWNTGHGTEQPQPGQTLEIWAFTFRNEKEGINDADAAVSGAQDILIERIAETAELRQLVRDAIFKNGAVKTDKGEKATAQSKFDKYFAYEESIEKLLDPQNSHRYLAARRGWMQEELKLSIGGPASDTEFESRLLESFETFACTVPSAPGAAVLMKAAKLALKAHVMPSIENEVHTALKKVADEAAIKVFSENVRKLLLASPFGSKAVLGVDPGVRTGCKLALVDDSGKYIADTVIHLQTEAEQNRAKTALIEVAKTGRIRAIAVGNGTAGRETERFIRNAMKDAGVDVPVVMVNEAGASVYSASEVAREEFPDLDVTVRGAISIARRLQDPLAELVKIDPKSIGVGQYQHDVSQPMLKKSLDLVVESCVNQVGVNLNTASYHLLSHVAGIGPALAKGIVEHRATKGLFKSRQQLLDVPRFSKKAFEQAAGFLRIPDSEHPLDNTGVHPERYSSLEGLAAKLNKGVKDLLGAGVALVREAKELKAALGEFTFEDIIKELEKPGRDPRDAFSSFQYRDDIHELKDLQLGMICPGVVTNVTNFGAFVDIGVHQDGLVHISQLSHKFVSDPNTVVKPGDQVKVKVLEVNLEKKQIALTMKLEEAPARGERSADRGARPMHGGQQRSGGPRPAVAAVAASGSGKRPDVRPVTNKQPPKQRNQFQNNPFAGLAGMLNKKS